MSFHRKIAYEGNRTLTRMDATPPTLGPGDVRLAVAYTGICGTDLHILAGHMDWRVKLPAVLGHETAGTVVDVGRDVADWAVGDRVTVLPVLPCGLCEVCIAGKAHICPQLVFLGIDADGAMQDTWVVPSGTLFSIPDGLPMAHAAVIEPLAVACHSVRRAGLTAGSDVIVTGAGPIGVLIGFVVSSLGARVLISEVSPVRRLRASGLGFDTVDPLASDFGEQVAAWANGSGPHIGFEAAGSPTALGAIISCLRPGGRIVPVGIHAEPAPVDMFAMFWKELELTASRLYTADDYHQALALAAGGSIPFDELITSVVPLPEAASAFETLGDAEAMKILIECSGDGDG